MRENQYESPYLSIVFLQEQDVITLSVNEGADDMGEWNGDWFPQKNG